MCGVAGWLGPGGYGSVYRLLLEQQHRGHDAAGAAWPREGRVEAIGGPGLVFQALPGSAPAPEGAPVIGHVRYSTSGGYQGSQPVTGPRGLVAVAFNGNIVNFREAVAEVAGAGAASSVSWDAEALALVVEELLAGHGSLADAVREAAGLLVGAYSLVAVSARGELVAARDPLGVRPLAYSLGDGYAAVASETGALNAMGLAARELAAGGMLYCPEPRPEGCSLERLAPAAPEPLPCAFEYIYLLRPDSVFEGVNAHAARRRMGALLARMDPLEPDVVAPVPDSGRSAALGYAEEKGARLEEVLYVNRFAGRAFISSPGERARRLSMKYSLIPGTVEGRRVALVDDSIVRGDTGRRLSSLIRSGGAREVHLRSAAPPVVSPCFFGVDIPTRRELIAYGRRADEIARILGFDSVLYNTVRNLEAAVGRRLCMGCFTGIYPYRLDVDSLEEVFGYSRRGAYGEVRG